VDAILSKKSGSTFHCDNTDALVEWLCSQGFHKLAGLHSYEEARLVRLGDQREEIIVHSEGGVVKPKGGAAYALLAHVVSTQNVFEIMKWRKHEARHGFNRPRAVRKKLREGYAW
jgi:hypothetical protein